MTEISKSISNKIKNIRNREAGEMIRKEIHLSKTTIEVLQELADYEQRSLKAQMEVILMEGAVKHLKSM